MIVSTSKTPAELPKGWAEYQAPILLAAAKTQALANLEIAYEAHMAMMVEGYSKSQIATFPQQKEEARNYLADPLTADITMIAEIAAVRGIPVGVLAGYIMDNAAAFADGAGYFTGRQQLLRDAILAATSPAAALAINW